MKHPPAGIFAHCARFLRVSFGGVELSWSEAGGDVHTVYVVQVTLHDSEWYVRSRWSTLEGLEKRLRRWHTLAKQRKGASHAAARGGARQGGADDAADSLPTLRDASIGSSLTSIPWVKQVSFLG